MKHLFFSYVNFFLSTHANTNLPKRRFSQRNAPGTTYNHLYKNSNYLILYTHTNIHHDSTFALNGMRFEVIYIYIYMIHVKLKIFIHLLPILN